MKHVLLAAMTATLTFAGAEPHDAAVITAFKHADPALQKFHVLRRASVSGSLDVVVALAGRQWGTLPDGAVTWGEAQSLGIFLQARENPGRVFLIDVRRGENDCWARVERVTETDTVVSSEGEKYTGCTSQKFIYDLRAKSLIRQFRYMPFSATRIFPTPDGAAFLASDDKTSVVIGYKSGPEPAFRILSEAQARPFVARADKPAGSPPHVLSLPTTTYDQFAAARPGRVKDGYVRKGTEVHDTPGPWQREQGRIWFGKTFYDGEGSTGVGGFGYFDEERRRLRMFAPPEIADWSVTALAVDPEAVWMSLASLGEGSNLSGGLLRFDRSTEAVRHFNYPDVAKAMAILHGQVLVASNFGIGIVDGERVRRYFLDSTGDGRYRVVEAAGQ